LGGHGERMGGRLVWFGVTQGREVVIQWEVEARWCECAVRVDENGW